VEVVHHEFQVGDFVRVALMTESAIRKQTFRKKIMNNWSAEVYQIYSISEPEAAGAQPQYLLLNLFTNRRSKKKYWSYQLQQVSEDVARQAVQQAQEHPRNMPSDEPEQEAEEAFPLAPPAPPRRSVRAYAPSQQALQNLAQAPSRWNS
jgi:hypothetical protein